jgi:Enoyl-CoA hydratase/isomerase
MAVDIGFAAESEAIGVGVHVGNIPSNPVVVKASTLERPLATWVIVTEDHRRVRSAMTEALVLVSQTEAVRTLTLNRPATLDSFASELHVELMTALNAAAEVIGTRCVVLTGAGRAFLAGQDLSDPMASPRYD